MFSGAELLAAAGVDPSAGKLPQELPGAAVDSRLVRPGELFVALRGEHTDGHRFIAGAVEAGAGAVVCAVPDETATARGIPQSVVADPLALLQQVARARLARQPETLVIGITGSAGKTSTKEAVAALLAQRA